MSEAVSPLNGARFKGSVMVQEEPPQGMITLRGDLASAAMVKAVKAAVKAEVPAQRMLTTGEGDALWMSPDELLVLVPYADADETVAKIDGAMGKAHHLAANVSDARALFTLTGPGIRDVLAKLTPADLSQTALPLAEVRRTRLAQVPAAFWFSADDTCHVICFRSVAQYVFDILKASANPMAEVGYS
ncbi:MAG: sarcosine oxidase subunit gamma family protein [Pseudomonadota bacterium]